MIRNFHLPQRIVAMTAMAGFAVSACAENAIDPAASLNATAQRVGTFTFDSKPENADQRLETTAYRFSDGSSSVLVVDYHHAAIEPRFNYYRGVDLRPAAFSFVSRNADGQEYSLGTGGMASHYFGAEGLEVTASGTMHAMPALGNPYFSLTPSTTHAGFSREVGGMRIKLGFLATGLSHAMAENAFDPESFSPALMTVQPRINSRVLEFSKSFDHAAISLSLMRSKEKSTPGMTRTVTAFGLGAPTSSAQLTGVWLVAPKIALAAQASYGRTPMGPAYGMIGGSNVTRSNAFAVGVVASDRYYSGDRLSFSVSQPIRVYASAISDDAGTTTQNVVPTGREVLAELNYVRPMGKTAYGGWAFSIRRHPDNMADAPTEKQLMLRYVMNY